MSGTQFFHVIQLFTRALNHFTKTTDWVNMYKECKKETFTWPTWHKTGFSDPQEPTERLKALSWVVTNSLRTINVSINPAFGLMAKYKCDSTSKSRLFNIKHNFCQISSRISSLSQFF